MEFDFQRLNKEERVVLEFKKVYEQYGFSKFKMSRFEEYGFYLSNKNFLSSEHIISFSDRRGRLLALKPDVTLSIAKNAEVKKGGTEKLYYIENVYRFDKHTSEYKEIQQIGLEVMGDIDGYATLEVITLAAKSLAAIDDDFVLDISHMGFLSGLLESVAIDDSLKKEKLFSCLIEKNTHDLIRIAESAALPDADKKRLLAVAQISGGLGSAIEKAEEISVGEKMKNAVSDLKALYEAAKGSGYAKNLRLDFSIVNDTGYYNGIIFQGYVKRIPRLVLSGGRYDLLMKKFGKDIGALGFALALDELGGYYKSGEKILDEVILYDGNTPPETVAYFVEKETARGLFVAAFKILPDCPYKKLMKIEKGALTEVTNV